MTHPDLFGVRVLIFDVDGTLIKSGELAKSALREALSRFFNLLGEVSPEYSDEQLLAGIGMRVDDFYQSLLPPHLKARWLELHDLIVDREAWRLERQHITFPGVIKTLSTLRRRGYRTAIVTNANREYLDSVLDTQNLRRHFDCTLAINDHENASKTSLIADVIRELGDRAVMIGDRYYDVDAAIANGIPSVGALYGYGERKELEETSTWIEDIRDLTVLFNPLRELAEAVADEINSRRFGDRPTSVGVSAVHSKLSAPLIGYLITALTELNISVNYLSLERHRKLDPLADKSPGRKWIDSAYPWRKLAGDILEPCRNGGVDARWEITTGEDAGNVQPYRARPGDVLLIDGPFLFRDPISRMFDLRYLVNAERNALRRSLQQERGNHKQRSDRLLNRYLELERAYRLEDNPERGATRIFEGEELLRAGS